MKIFLIGFMGCGKSHWGKQLSLKMNFPFFDLDEKIVEDEGMPITTIFAEKGEEYFRMLEKEVLYMITNSHKTFVMACGGGIPCFYNNIDFMKNNGFVVFVNCSTESIFQRLLKEKDKRPLISSYPDNKLKEYIIKKYSSRKIYYQQANLVVNDEDLTIEKFVDLIFHG